MCTYDTASVIGKEMIKPKIKPKDESKKIIQQFIVQTLVID